ncbi:PKD-like family lipoprotein [Chitinophaga arvensicola]|uniref:PKD-like family protein n=1 Tax=Chitinophaga arvensicola TaxID=29529 RepID=A0A1I0S8X7_9BACT|nr:PKD-like family lipoprotein [Chitinophaga arvensicola]SEW52560.1 PKD-like family protein [Chitinophaga arvensicola]
MLLRYKKKGLIPLLLAGSLWFSSCYKDQGNYDYKEINKVTIDTFAGNLSVYRFDTLQITPVISANLDKKILDDTTRFSYLWVANQQNSTSYELGTTRNLRAKIDIPVGSYSLYFEMTDKVTGNIYSQLSKSFTVMSSTYEGWLVFSDVNGRATLDMVNLLKGKPDAITRDILSASPVIPKQLTGPRDVAYVYTYILNIMPPPYHNATYGDPDHEWIYICTDQGAWKLRNDDLTTRWEWGMVHETTLTDSSSFRPAYVGANGAGAFQSTVSFYDGKGNFYERGGTAAYSVRMNRVNGEATAYRAAPFLGRYYNMGGTSYTTLFDVDKKRFLRHKPGSNVSSLMEYNPTSMPLFNFNDIGMDLVWMRAVPYNYLTYAVMKDPAGARWLLTFNVISGISQDKKVKLTGPEIEKATMFAADKNYGTLFYAVGGRIYATSKDFPEQTYKVLDLGDKTITYMDQHSFRAGNYNGSDANAKGSWLMVGYTDPAGTPGANGTLAAYLPANFVNGHGALTQMKAYTGFGIIKSLSYRERF